jgi:galactokinase
MSAVPPAAPERLVISTPGRVCLFGEHQDYLGLPVIPCAISRRIALAGKARTDREAHIDLPDIGSREHFPLTAPLLYGAERDYFRSAVNVLLRGGFTFRHGVDCTVRGNIPINSGTSSSSALIITWINFLARFSDAPTALPPAELARLAHAAEVLEFGEPGGQMDHYSTAFGGVLFLEFVPQIRVRPLAVPLGTFVLGDSGEPKDTRGILARVKQGVLQVVERLKEIQPGFSLHEVTHASIDALKAHLSSEEATLLHGTIRNRDLTREALALCDRPMLDHRRFGALLSEHQTVLRDVLRISTPKIDRMLSAALEAGAVGGKINGSGGGGCMFAYAPERPEEVAAAIERAGGRAYVVTPDEGSRVESPEHPWQP